MSTKHFYLIGNCVAAVIFMLIIAATVEQNKTAPVKNAPTLMTLTATEQPSTDPGTLLAIENALQSIQDIIPALKHTITQNQLANEKRIDAIERNIKQVTLALQHADDSREQPVETTPEVLSPKEDHELAEERAQAVPIAYAAEHADDDY